jgi:hypothetical protein
VTFIETVHGRLRRQQRGIDKKDLQLARKHGTRRSTHPRTNGDPPSIYRYRDIAYVSVVNDVTSQAVTPWAEPIPLEPVSLDTEHDATERVARDLRVNRGEDTSWGLSNTIFVVDTSRRMARSDVWGYRAQLQAAFDAVALDFVDHLIDAAGPLAQEVVFP